MIFDNKTVVGLFDNDTDVEQTLTELRKHGFGEENNDQIKVLEHPLDMPTGPGDKVEQATEGATVQAASAAGSQAVPVPGQTPADTHRDLEKKLHNLGVSSNETEYYAQQAVRGNTLVVVKTDSDRATKVSSIMEQTNTRSSIS